tara:strand:- start:22388 stop:23131 length:744 start_codon:yes stop_codon:yes gene_type:complete
MKNLENKIAIVTGGNSGIGYATAKQLISDGATVIITGRRLEAIEKAAKELGAIPFLSDQSNLEDINMLHDYIKTKYGKVDILFINAGITGTTNPIENTSVENFDTVMNINFRGAYFTLSRLIPLLNEGASVVFLSSNVATTNFANSSVYQASKAAINSIGKTAAAELAPRKIRVNMVSPGPTHTNVLNKSYDEITAQGIWDNLSSSIPLNKIGKSEDVAKMVAYLCYDSSSYITGADFLIDGGMVLS